MSVRVNVGCGSRPTRGWVNLDNSPSVLLSQMPDRSLSALRHFGLLNDQQLDIVRTARQASVRRADATKLPFRDSSVDVVYSSHMLEHLDREQAAAFIRETLRVLRPGGWIRVVVPDLRFYVQRYQQGGSADELVAELRLVLPRVRGRRRAVSQLVGFRGHRWMYDEDSLVALLESSGFEEVTGLPAGETRIPDPGELDLRERQDESVYCEGRKPG